MTSNEGISLKIVLRYFFLENTIGLQKKNSLFGEKLLNLECKKNVLKPKWVSLLVWVAMET